MYNKKKIIILAEKGFGYSNKPIIKESGKQFETLWSHSSHVAIDIQNYPVILASSEFIHKTPLS